MSEDAVVEETAVDVGGELPPEELLASVMSLGPLELTAGQTPVVITGYRGDVIPDPVITATPVDPVDGGDGSHTTAAAKDADYAWKPFVPPVSFPNLDQPNYFPLTPATQVQNTTNDTAVVAANALTKF